MAILTVHSGGQTGVDQAALRAARACGLPTGGWAPYGYQTLDGIDDTLRDYGLRECQEVGYKPRTRLNVRDCAATLRLARTFSSPGERCTAQAIRDFDKPSLDVHYARPLPPTTVAEWICATGVYLLNVAGNSEDTAPGIGVWAEAYLIEVFKHVQEMRLGEMGCEG